jgi:hypothetical protein
VIYRSGGTVVPSCLNRTVQVIPVGGLREVFDALAPLSSHLQTVGVAGPGPRRTELLEGLARIGVTRIVDLTRVPWPAPWWHHDGSGPLRALIRWTDAEGI